MNGGRFDHSVVLERNLPYSNGSIRRRCRNQPTIRAERNRSDVVDGAGVPFKRSDLSVPEGVLSSTILVPNQNVVVCAAGDDDTVGASEESNDVYSVCMTLKGRENTTVFGILQSCIHQPPALICSERWVVGKRHEDSKEQHTSPRRMQRVPTVVTGTNPRRRDDGFHPKQ